MIRLTTLCYLERQGMYLMLHRISKKEDVNAGKWIGIGGKFEPGEAPEDCLIRETREETGFLLQSARFRGILTFIYDDRDPEYIFTYTSEDFVILTEEGTTEDAPASPASPQRFSHGEAGPDTMNPTGGKASNERTGPGGGAALPVPVCDEGIFAWVRKEDVFELELWEGDRYLLQYLLEDRPEPFSLKLCYDREDRLTGAWELSRGPVRLK